MDEPRRWEFAGAWLLAAVFCAGLASLLQSHERLLWASAVSQGVWGCLAFGLASLLPGRPARRLGLGPGRLRVPVLLALAIGLLLLSDGLSVILESLEVRHSGALGEVHRRAASARAPLPLVGALFALALAPGIAEELLFRGALQRPLAARLGPGAGVTLAAALFGLAHLDPVQGPAAFCLGLYLGWVAVLAGSTRAAIFCHVVNNGMSTLGSRFGGLGLPLPAGLAAPLLVAGGVAVLVWVWRRHGIPEGTPETAEAGVAPG